MARSEPRNQSREYRETINGVKLRFKVSGSGPLCVFQTPGWGPEIGVYEGLSGFEDILTMVYLDTRGTGASERPPESTVTYDNLAADVEGIRRFFDAETAVTMGHSFGGVLCIEHVLRYPDSVAGLILIDTPVAEVEEVQADRQQRMQGMSGEPWFPEAMEAFGTLMSGHMPSSDEEFARLARGILPPYFVDQAVMERFMDRTGEAVWSHDAYRSSFNLSLDDLRPRLGEIDAPAVILVGSEDFICGPIQSRWLNDGLRRSALVEFEGVGHFPWVEKPDEFFTRAKAELRALGIA